MSSVAGRSNEPLSGCVVAVVRRIPRSGAPVSAEIPAGITAMTRTDGGGIVVVLRQVSVYAAARRATRVQRLFRMQPRGVQRHRGRRRRQRRRRRQSAAVKCTGIIVVRSQHSVLELVFGVEGDVGGLDVHEGDRGRAAVVAAVIALLAKDLDALNTTKSERKGEIIRTIISPLEAKKPFPYRNIVSPSTSRQR